MIDLNKSFSELLVLLSVSYLSSDERQIAPLSPAERDAAPLPGWCTYTTVGALQNFLRCIQLR